MQETEAIDRVDRGEMGGRVRGRRRRGRRHLRWDQHRDREAGAGERRTAKTGNEAADRRAREGGNGSGRANGSTYPNGE